MLTGVFTLWPNSLPATEESNPAKMVQMKSIPDGDRANVHGCLPSSDLQALIDAASGLCFLIDLAGTIICTNRKAVTHFGLEMDELVGTNVFSLFDEATAEGRRQAIRQAQRQKEPVVLEDERNGICFRHNIVPVVDADGQVRRVAVFAQDVTQVKKIDHALRESEQRYRLLAENTADTVWQLDRQMRFEFVNAAYLQLTGYPKEEVLGRNVMDFFTAEGQAIVRDMMTARKRAEDQGQTNLALRFEIPHLRKNAEPFWAEINSNPIYDSSGTLIGFNGIMRDVDQRKRVELALRASEERFRFLAENTSDVVWELGLDMRFTYINSADERTRGFHRDEVIGRPVMELFTPEGQAIIGKVTAAREAAERSGTNMPELKFQAPQIRKDGSSYWTEVSSMRRRDANGDIIGFNGITRNIDERKRYERELEEANLRLKAQLAEIVQLQAQLKEQTLRDPLTGLHNRRYLEETLTRELARAKRDGYPLAFIMLDLDHFKKINDIHGHAAGDTVLKDFAAMLMQGAREGDVICRYGGEEFLILLPNMTLEQGRTRAESWRSRLESTLIKHEDRAIAVTLSAGIAEYPSNGNDTRVLLRLADEALYRAKDGGRNRVAVTEASCQP